jgi:hypothetical protein
MTRHQMLEHFGVSDENFRDYLKKYCSFLNSLDRKQREFHYDYAGRSTVEEVAAALGPDVTARDVEHLFAECPPVHGMCITACCRNI